MRVVAIDGPAGTGKSTVARELSRRLGLRHLDTGAMYRAVTWAVLDAGIDPADAEGAAGIARTARLDLDEGGVRVDGHDVTGAIRGPAVTAAVSAVSAHPDVRAALVARQREWVTSHGGGVLEGRDIGTVVFPDAELKLYLTASPVVRAARRAAESGGDVHSVAADLARRDRADSSRAASPLQEAADAVVLDTSDLTPEAVVERILHLLPSRPG